MSDDALKALADAAGLSLSWIDYLGKPHAVSVDTARRILAANGLPCDNQAQAADSLGALGAESRSAMPPLITASVGEPVHLRTGWAQAGAPYEIRLDSGAALQGTLAASSEGRCSLPAPEEPGYHRLALGQRECTLAVAPRRCWSVSDTGKPRLWGLAAQLYSLRRAGDGGLGDFGALAQLAGHAARKGADAVAISPVHALFGADLHRFGPYAPSSRLFLNALHADPSAVFGAAAVTAAAQATGWAAEAPQLEALALVDWPAAARLRLMLAKELYRRFRQGLGGVALAADFDEFCRLGGEALRDHARFEALQGHLVAQGEPCWHWRDWPTGLRDPRSAEVEAFAASHGDAVGFHLFQQWLAQRSLAAAQAAARAAGMAVGLIGDLAVGADGGGSHAWSRQGDFLQGMSVGAPPDLLNTLGQSWGLTAFSARAMVQHGFAPFIEMLRAALRTVGGLRIDHVLGMQRLWLVPEGAAPTEGAYLRYPMEDLFRLIALESWRHRALIVGEDLGTVPEGFRERLSACGVMGLRVLWFEREWGLYHAPWRWQADAVATTSTHDVATVAGWWSGRDIEWRTRLGLLGPGITEAAEREQRGRDRNALWAAFEYAGVTQGPAPAPEQPGLAVDAAVASIGSTPSQLVMLPLEDALALEEQPNIPGTIDEHPNWRRRLPGPVETLLEAPAVAARLERLEAAVKGERKAGL